MAPDPSASLRPWAVTLIIEQLQSPVFKCVMGVLVDKTCDRGWRLTAAVSTFRGMDDEG